MSVAPSIEPLQAAPAAQTTGLLFERHSTRLYAFCLRRLRTREEAEDAVQQTFMKAHAAARNGFVPEAEKAWLYRIAENVCTDRLRSATYRRRHESAPDALDAVPAPASRPEQLDGIGDALAALSEQQRRAVVLREWHGLTYREIAGELDLSQSAVETLLFRARRSLARKLQVASFFPWLKSFLTGGAGAKATAAAVATIGIGALTVPPAIDRLRESSEPARAPTPAPALTDRPDARPLVQAPRPRARGPESRAPNPAARPTGEPASPGAATRPPAAQPPGEASVSETRTPAPARDKPISTLPALPPVPALPDTPVPPVSLPAPPEVELPAPEDVLAPVGDVVDELPALPALP